MEEVPQNEIFFSELEELLEEYKEYLKDSFAISTIKKHCEIITVFNEFVCFQHNVEGFEQITIGIANSKFLAYYNGNFDTLLKSTCKHTLKGFFLYLNNIVGIKCTWLLKSFDKK